MVMSLPVMGNQLSPERLIDFILSLARSDILALFSPLLSWLKTRLFPHAEGIYEVLDYEARLDLCDPKGKLAIYTKRQRVRFLQDNVIAYQDQAFGDGEIFAEYKCSPGVPVDRYEDGYRYRVLISLRQTKNRGDVEEFFIERHIKDGFTKVDGYFQTNVDHRTDKLSLTVVFPPQRKPFEVSLVEQDTARTTVLGGERMRQLPDGKWLVEWSTAKPKRFESYILRWKW